MSIQAVLLAIALMLGAGVLAEPVAEVLRLPRMLVCIAAGAALGPSGLRWVDVPLGSRGTQVALSLGVAIVLFHGGLQLSARVLAQVAPGLTMLAIVGVVATAVIVGSVAAAAFGLPIRSGLIVGAVLAPTDPAILIPIFDRLRVAPKIAQTIIAESALNDPAGALLTLVLAGMVVHTGSSTAHSLREYLVEVVVAALAGLAVGAGFSCLASSHRAGRLWRNLAPSGVLAMIAGAVFAAGPAGGSTYLGAFVAGLVVANAESLGVAMRKPHVQELRLLVGTVTGMIVNLVFVLLGVSLPFAAVARHWEPALGTVAALCLLARPVVVLLCLAPDRRAQWTRRELLFVAATRETGVLPAALAVTLVGMKFTDADLVTTTVAVALVVTVGIQATLKPWLASRLGLLTVAEGPVTAPASAQPGTSPPEPSESRSDT